jgi:hypothetical protein
MPAPMPPQEQDPNAQPGQGGPAPTGGDAQGGSISQLIMNMSKAIDHIAQVVNQSPQATPAMKKAIGQADQAFGGFVDALQGGGAEPDGDESGGGQGQTVPPEAGGNKGAIPHPF